MMHWFDDKWMQWHALVQLHRSIFRTERIKPWIQYTLGGAASIYEGQNGQQWWTAHLYTLYTWNTMQIFHSIGGWGRENSLVDSRGRVVNWSRTYPGKLRFIKFIEKLLKKKYALDPSWQMQSHPPPQIIAGYNGAQCHWLRVPLKIAKEDNVIQLNAVNRRL